MVNNLYQANSLTRYTGGTGMAIFQSDLSSFKRIDGTASNNAAKQIASESILSFFLCGGANAFTRCVDIILIECPCFKNNRPK